MVHHLRGHIAALYLTHPELKPPFLCLVASGGHSHIVEVQDYTHYHILGHTVDDAAGEAFDKVARTLGLPYPGGPSAIQCSPRPATSGLPPAGAHVDGKYNGFSGLKTMRGEQGPDKGRRMWMPWPVTPLRRAWTASAGGREFCQPENRNKPLVPVGMR